jgi:hypothetical protein
MVARVCLTSGICDDIVQTLVEVALEVVDDSNRMNVPLGKGIVGWLITLIHSQERGHNDEADVDPDLLRYLHRISTFSL